MKKIVEIAITTVYVLTIILAIAALDKQKVEATERDVRESNAKSAMMTSRAKEHPFYAELSRADGDAFNEFDRDKDGRVTLEEAMASMGRQFELLDLNKDGFVDYEEIGLAQVVVGMVQNGYRPAKVHSMHPSIAMSRMLATFPFLDMNEDEKFSFEEMRPGIESWFRVYDINRDNVIERAELFFEVPPAWLGALRDSDRRIMGRFNAFDENEDGRTAPAGFNFAILVYARFDEFDHDKDGQITFGEYMTTLREKFDLFDRDKDGFLNYFESYSGGDIVDRQQWWRIYMPGATRGIRTHSRSCSFVRVVKRDTPNYLLFDNKGGGGRCSFQDLTPGLERDFRLWDANNDGVVKFPEMVYFSALFDYRHLGASRNARLK